MNPSEMIGCLFVFVLLLHTLIGIGIGMAMQKKYNISDNKAICISFFWSFIMLFTLFTLSCKKIKQSIALKEADKIEEDKRKKELVNTVLKELKLR